MFKIIFSWWNRQTFGTFLNTLIFGINVGNDEQNKYYRNKSDKIGNLPKDVIDTPCPHSWIHKIIKSTPGKILEWQKIQKTLTKLPLDLTIQI